MPKSQKNALISLFFIISVAQNTPYLPATVDIIVLEVVPADGALDFAPRLPAAVEQVGVHDEVVVCLQGRPEIVLAEAGVGGAALQAARAVAVPAAPRPSPQFALCVTFLLQNKAMIGDVIIYRDMQNTKSHQHTHTLTFKLL